MGRHRCVLCRAVEVMSGVYAPACRRLRRFLQLCRVIRCHTCAACLLSYLSSFCLPTGLPPHLTACLLACLPTCHLPFCSDPGGAPISRGSKGLCIYLPA